jgi:hypothetical protein
LIEGENIDRRSNAIRGTGDPIIFCHWMPEVTSDEDRDGRALAYGQDRIGAGRRCAAEIEDDDIGFAVADQIEKAGLRRIGVIC